MSIFPAGVFGLLPTDGGSVIGAPSFLSWLPLGLGYAIIPGGSITIADDGGEYVTITGPFSDGDVCTVAIDGVPCYSGVFGQGNDCIARNGRVVAVTPADLHAWQVIGPTTVPYGGPYDLTVTLPDTTVITLAAVVTVVRRNRRTDAYNLARYFPPPVYAPGPSLLDSGLMLLAGATVPAVVSPARGFVDAVGQIITSMQGLIFTRLVAPLAPALLGTSPGADAFTAEVETVYGFPPAGVIIIDGEIIAYTGTDQATATITGLVRDDAISTPYPVGTPVAIYTQDRSDYENARGSLIVSTAEGRFLDVIGNNYGVPRYYGLPDALYRRLIRTLAYQAGRGTRTAIGRLLDALLFGQGFSGTDGAITAPNTLTSAAGGFTSGMYGLRVRLNDDSGQIYRISAVVDANTLTLDPNGSSLEWVAADLANATGVPFEVLPWDILPDPYRPGLAIIRINYAPPTSPVGFAYLNGGEAATASTTTTVDTAYPIRQVLGVWLATDTERTGTNYATTNNFSGQTITLDVALPGTVAVLIDYGAVTNPVASTSGIPGEATGPGTAQILKDVTWHNPALAPEIAAQGYGQPPPIVRYPLYLGDRIAYLLPILEIVTAAGVRPVLDAYQW